MKADGDGDGVNRNRNRNENENENEKEELSVVCCQLSVRSDAGSGMAFKSYNSTL